MKSKINEQVLSRQFTKKQADSAKLIMSYIEYGKVNEMHQFLQDSHMSESNVYFSAANSLRSMKNLFISSTALAYNSAILGGMDYETATRTMEEYVQKVETMSDQSQIIAPLNR